MYYYLMSTAAIIAANTRIKNANIYQVSAVVTVGVALGLGVSLYIYQSSIADIKCTILLQSANSNNSVLHQGCKSKVNSITNPQIKYQ